MTPAVVNLGVQRSFGARGVPWHTAADLGSAAFWIDQTRRSTLPPTYRLGRDLLEEAAACLLGGHGVTGAMTLAAFQRVRDWELLATPAGWARTHESRLEAALREPLELPGGRTARYRFPRQRAVRLAALVRAIPGAPEAGPARGIRDWLQTLPGFGPKTASWAARNHTGAEDIAVIDIHVHRAGLLAGVFSDAWRLPRDYEAFEEAFVEWAQAGGVRASDLDACIWHQLSSLGRRRHVLFG